LFIGAHPDDVELGCGGAILKHLENGDAVYVMVVTDGESGSKTQQFGDDRLTETIKSLQFAGIEKDRVICLHLPDTEVWRERQKLLDAIVQACKDYKIDYVYTHSAQAYHQDHITIFEETIRGAKGTSGIFAYETNGGTKTSFAPNFFVNIEDVFDKKMRMLKFHRSQSGKDYFDIHTIEALSRVRAAQSKIYKYAEAFELLRLSLSITPPTRISKGAKERIRYRKSTPLLSSGGVLR
jgi:LmbE family N-acetylglucosaminyl deacetylase